MKLKKPSLKLLIALALVVLGFLAVSFRVFLPYHDIFSPVGIKFSAIDAYYQMRIVDNLAHNFPHLYSFDPYFIFPGGNALNQVHFFNWLLAGIVWIIGLGSPSAHLINVVGVFFPAILAGLVVFPVYFIGRTLFNRGAGLLAALLIAVLPGEYIGRSILGFTDTHIVEVLFSTTAALFLILAVKAARERQLTLEHLLRWDWPVVRRPLLYAVLGGLFSGIYLVSWQGALLFMFIITLYFVIQFLVEFFMKRPTEYLSIVTFVLFLVAFLIFFSFSPHILYTLALIGALAVPVVFGGLVRLARSLRLKTFWFPVALVATAAIALVIFNFVNPTIFRAMLDQFTIFHPSGASAATTSEMQPFLAPNGQVTTAIAYGNFTTSFFLLSSNLDPATLWWFPGFGLISIIVGIWLWVAWKDDPDRRRLLYWLLGVLAVVTIVFWFVTPAEWKLWVPGIAFVSLVLIIVLGFHTRKFGQGVLFFCLWTVVILFATIGQRRFAYYLAVNIALLSGFALALLVWYAGWRRLRQPSLDGAEPVEQGKKKKAKRRMRDAGFGIYYVNIILAVLVGFFFVVFPNIGKARGVASTATYAPSDAWQESLLWMKDNTPEPLGNPDDYYHAYDLTPGVPFRYPDSAYGVLSWWDYGYWITRIAHRIPVSNPSQVTGPIMQTAYLFLTEDRNFDTVLMREAAWNMLIDPAAFQRYYDEVMKTRYLLDRVKPDYIVSDYQTSTSKFWAVLTWGDRNIKDYTEVYYFPYEGKLVPVQLYYPAYYRTLIVRLYSFHGEAVASVNPMVIKYSNISAGSVTVRRIDDYEEFDSYEAAEAYIAAQTEGNYVIASEDPFVSPVPLPPVRDYELVYSSSQTIHDDTVGDMPQVVIFRRTSR